MEAYWGTGSIGPRILDFGTRIGEWPASRLSCFTLRTNWIGSWVSPRADLDSVAKIKSDPPLPGIVSRSSSP